MNFPMATLAIAQGALAGRLDSSVPLRLSLSTLPSFRFLTVGSRYVFFSSRGGVGLVDWGRARKALAALPLAWSSVARRLEDI